MIINVSAVANVVASKMVSVVDANRSTFINTDDFESVFENCFNMEVGDKLTGDRYTKVYQLVENDPEIQLAYTVIKEMIAEDRQNAIQDLMEQESIRRNPKAYYGV